MFNFSDDESSNHSPIGSDAGDSADADDESSIHDETNIEAEPSPKSNAIEIRAPRGEGSNDADHDSDEDRAAFFEGKFRNRKMTKSLEQERSPHKQRTAMSFLRDRFYSMGHNSPKLEASRNQSDSPITINMEQTQTEVASTSIPVPGRLNA